MKCITKNVYKTTLKTELTISLDKLFGLLPVLKKYGLRKISSNKILLYTNHRCESSTESNMKVAEDVYFEEPLGLIDGTMPPVK